MRPLLLLSLAACIAIAVGQDVVGQKGQKGDQGPAGAPGLAGVCSGTCDGGGTVCYDHYCEFVGRLSDI